MYAGFSMIFGGLLSLTLIFKLVRGKQPHHNHGHRYQKWPPIAAHELQFWEHVHRIDRRRWSEQANMLFSCNGPVYGPRSAPMVRWWQQWISPPHWSVLRVIDPLIERKNIRLLGALFPVDPAFMCLKLEFLCSDRGPFLAAAAMVMGGVLGLWPWCLRQCKP